MSDDWDREMMRALQADAEKLEALTGEEHEVCFLLDGACPECGGDGYWVRGIPATWSDPPDAEEVRCDVCLGTGLAVLWGNWEKLP